MRMLKHRPARDAENTLQAKSPALWGPAPAANLDRKDEDFNISLFYDAQDLDAVR